MKSLLSIGLVSILFFSLSVSAKTLSKPGAYKVEDITFTMIDPNDYGLRVRSIRPKFSKYPREHFPIVLRIAGGWGNSIFLLDNEIAKKLPLRESSL